MKLAVFHYLRRDMKLAVIGVPVFLNKIVIRVLVWLVRVTAFLSLSKRRAVAPGIHRLFLDMDKIQIIQHCVHMVKHT